MCRPLSHTLNIPSVSPDYVMQYAKHKHTSMTWQLVPSSANCEGLLRESSYMTLAIKITMLHLKIDVLIYMTHLTETTIVLLKE